MRKRLILGAVVAAALAAAPAHAAEPTITGEVNFDDVPVGTQVDEAYAAKGVHFGPPERWGLPLEHKRCTGSLATVDGGISGRSLGFGCRANENDFEFNAALQFDDEQSSVSFVLRSRSGRHEPLRIRAFDLGGRVIDSREVKLPVNFPQRITIQRDQPEIVSVVMDTYASNYREQLDLDDLSFTRPDPADRPAEPKFALRAGPELQLYEGSTGHAKLNLIRVNGSTGPITLSIPDLPAGIAAANLDPNPASGTKPPELAVTARSPVTGQRQLVVSAAAASAGAGKAVGGPIIQSLRIDPALEAPGVIQTGLVAGCDTGTAEAYVNVRGDFRGAVDLGFSRRSGPVLGADGSVRADASGPGELRFPLHLSQPAVHDGESWIDLRFRPAGATPVTSTMRVFDDHVRIGRLISTPKRLSQNVVVPKSAGMSDTIALEGHFPSGCRPKFVDGLNRELEIVTTDHSWPLDSDRIVLRLPEMPVSTVIRALGAGDQELAHTTEKLDLIGFRNDAGIQVANSGMNAGAPSLSWDAFKRIFGSDDVDNCFITCWRNPVAKDYYEMIKAELAKNSGLCLAFSSIALRFDHGLVPASSYQVGAARLWDVANWSDGTAGKDELVRRQLSGYDPDWWEYYESRFNKPVGQFHDELRETLKRDGSVLIALKNGSKGHAVVAYDIQEAKDGAFYILTYNPNTPYTANEETTPDAHKTALEHSRIYVRNDGAWFGGIYDSHDIAWTGWMNQIAMIDRLPPDDPGLPNNGFFARVWGLLGAASVEGISVDGKQALRTDGTAEPGTGVTVQPRPTGVEDVVDYRLDPGHAYEMNVKGDGKGSYNQSLLGKGVAATVSDASTAPGQSDAITLSPGQAKLAFRSGAASGGAKLELTAQNGKDAYTASATLATGGGATDALALANGAVELRRTGGQATTATVTLGDVSASGPASVSTAPLRLRAGERMTLKPRSWTDPGGGVRMTVRDARGRVVKRGDAPLRQSGAVAFAGNVKAKRMGGQVLVTGAVAKPGAAGVLVVRAEALRRGRVVRRAMEVRRGVKAGAFSVPVALRVPRGAKLRAIASLVDEAADNATARKQANAR